MSARCTFVPADLDPFQGRRCALGIGWLAAAVVCAGLAIASPGALAEDHGGGHGPAAAPAAAHGAAHEAGHDGGHAGAEETAPEAFVVLDLFSEALEASFAGIGIKIAELKPKVEHVNELYDHGERHKAFAKVLGISTEVVLLGFLIETFGVGDLFLSALSFSGNWLMQMAQSTAGILVSTKVALFAGEKVEEATEEKYEHAIQLEAKPKKPPVNKGSKHPKTAGSAHPAKSHDAEPHRAEPHPAEPHPGETHPAEVLADGHAVN